MAASKCDFQVTQPPLPDAPHFLYLLSPSCDIPPSPSAETFTGGIYMDTL